MRKALSAILALVFFVAVLPGTMAMPAPQPVAAAATTCHCDHMKLKDQNSPCKGMAVCIGLLGCLGLAVIVNDQPALYVATSVHQTHGIVVTATGLTHPPDMRPPIV